MGSDESHFNVSLIVRDKVTGQSRTSSLAIYFFKGASLLRFRGERELELELELELKLENFILQGL